MIEIRRTEINVKILGTESPVIEAPFHTRTDRPTDVGIRFRTSERYTIEAIIPAGVNASAGIEGAPSQTTGSVEQPVVNGKASASTDRTPPVCIKVCIAPGHNVGRSKSRRTIVATVAFTEAGIVYVCLDTQNEGFPTANWRRSLLRQ